VQPAEETRLPLCERRKSRRISLSERLAGLIEPGFDCPLVIGTLKDRSSVGSFLAECVAPLIGFKAVTLADARNPPEVLDALSESPCVLVTGYPVVLGVLDECVRRGILPAKLRVRGVLLLIFA